MKYFNSLFYYRLYMLIFAAAIVVFSLVASHRFVQAIAEEERKKVELWAEATKVLAQAEFEPGTNFEFIHGVVESNTTVPSILVSVSSGAVLSTKNVDTLSINTPQKLAKRLRHMGSIHAPIEIHIPGEGDMRMYYDSSGVQRMLQNFPLVLLLAVALFVLLVVLVLSISKRSEQNLVWIGMAKETAHQLGTPISSLLGWVALLKEKEPIVAQELEKDVVKLEKISTRFSKIGTRDNLENADILQITRNCIGYMRKRASQGVEIVDATAELSVCARINTTLWEWVVENLIKNALDAIGDKQGVVKISAQQSGNKLLLDISDSGRGIAAKGYRKIFKPGYTTKPRGWGLGLSLCRRIVEGHYRGSIFVLNSEMGVGTTIRVVMNVA
jgi:anti-sigma regulatory factor (Ser/Thr protein kinase)